jgi:nitrate/nitrite-specific signal transduction histidine kinase
LFKNGIRNLLLLPGTPKCPTSYFKAMGSDVSNYVESLFSLLVSDMKKYMPRNWWSVDVVSMLLALLHQLMSSPLIGWRVKWQMPSLNLKRIKRILK